MVNASDVFESMFRFDGQNAKEKTSADCPPVIELPDVEAAAFKVLLSFIYAEDLNELNGDNAMADFSRLCLYYIDKNAESLLHSEQFLQIDQNLLCEIFGRDQLEICGEMSIWKAAFRWADAQCGQNGIGSSAENHRAVLGSALFQIRFPLIPKNAFDKTIASSDVLFSDEKSGICHFHSDQCPPKGFSAQGIDPLKFPSKGRFSDRSNKTLLLDIDKLSEFAREKHLNKIWNRTRQLPERTFSNVSNQWGTIFIDFEELMEPCYGMYDKKGDKVTLAIDVTTEKGRSEANKSVGCNY
ncbi:hypothetical protein niasHT_018340 [Heterodera trifolii]|uniref:BTB domain-containing protein n=1 Tax=Heterodera trifolii TaxID=157864 RepID=A0ABD2L325_9BILA